MTIATATAPVPATRPVPAAGVVDLTSRSTLREIGDLAASVGLRRATTLVEELPASDGTPIRRAAAIAVIRNPWAGIATGADLGRAHEHVAPVLAKILTDRLIDALGPVEQIMAFGKAAVAGVDGEIEHASALIHTAYFGNVVREALDGTSILCFADGIGEPGSTIRVPMWHKTAASTRDYYQTIEVTLSDGPHRDELAVIAAASTGPRPFARIGDRSTDHPVTTDILKGITL